MSRHEFSSVTGRQLQPSAHHNTLLVLGLCTRCKFRQRQKPVLQTIQAHQKLALELATRVLPLASNFQHASFQHATVTLVAHSRELLFASCDWSLQVGVFVNFSVAWHTILLQAYVDVSVNNRFIAHCAVCAEWQSRNNNNNNAPLCRQDTEALKRSRVSALTRDIDIAILSVRPSVRNAPVSDENGLTQAYCHSFFHHTVAKLFQFYRRQTFSQNSDRVTPCGGAKYRWGIKILRFATNKSLYLADDTRQRHSYYRRRIGNRTRAFAWHQFQ